MGKIISFVLPLISSVHPCSPHTSILYCIFFVGHLLFGNQTLLVVVHALVLAACIIIAVVTRIALIIIILILHKSVDHILLDPWRRTQRQSNAKWDRKPGKVDKGKG